MKQGPNVRRLIVHKMSVDAIPAGGGLADGVKFLSDPKGIVATAKAATEWVQQATATVRAAAEPNPFRDQDDEAIAGEILRQIGERKRGSRQGCGVMGFNS